MAKEKIRILEKNNFTCCLCGTKEKELHVHHTYYEPNKKPWEYDDVFLWCLCKKCHEYMKNLTDKIKRLIGYSNPEHIEQFIGYMKAYLYDEEIGNENFRKEIHKGNSEFAITDSIDEICGFVDFYKKEKWRELFDIVSEKETIHIDEIIKTIKRKKNGNRKKKS